jgi:alcohol dehydrogenase class IV
MLPHVMRYLAPPTGAPQGRIAEALGSSGCAADAVAELIQQLGLPVHLGAYGLSEADLVAAAKPVASEAYPLEELVAVYRAAM